jgi:Aromatic-ring hydroxylase, C-terminal
LTNLWQHQREVQIQGEAAWPELYGVSPAGAVLLRPDGPMAWRAPDAPVAGGGTGLATALEAATGKKMAVA